MILIMIDNKPLLSKLVNYFDSSKIEYTTDINDTFEYILLAEINNKTISIINRNTNKKIIFIAYLEEEKIFKNYNLTNKRSIKYKNKLQEFLNKCYLVVVSLPFFKYILINKIDTNIKIIERENPYFEEKKKRIKDKNIITCIDPNYNNINSIFNLANSYPDYTFKILGYAPIYKLSNKIRKLLRNSPTNIAMIKYYNNYTYLKYCQESFMVIYFDRNLLNIEYLLYVFLMRKVSLIKNSDLYNDYLINSKNTYLFDNYKELKVRFKKIIDHRVGNLTNEAYELIKDNIFDKISVKFSKYLK